MQTAILNKTATTKRRVSIVREDPRAYRTVFEEKVDEYIENLKRLETHCMEPGVDREHILREVTALTDDMLNECAKLEERFEGDVKMLKQAQERFRTRTHSILSKSYMINYTRTWPRGYQGDYHALETAYRNTPLSDGIGHYLDKYILSASLPVAVRGRLEKLRELLSAELTRRKDPAVLDIACGSCREVIELVPEIRQSGARFTCIDLDSEALNFALERLSHAGLPEGQIEFLTYNALRIFDYETAVAEFGRRDIIYSVGFFDYLPDEFLVKLLRTLYLLLNPGGKLIMAFKDADRYRSQEFHWLVDWDGFRQRKVADFERLLRQADIPANSMETCRDASGAIIFYSATR
jgi:SAM-dependent methyltransferase